MTSLECHRCRISETLSRESSSPCTSSLPLLTVSENSRRPNSTTVFCSGVSSAVRDASRPCYIVSFPYASYFTGKLSYFRQISKDTNSIVSYLKSSVSCSTQIAKAIRRINNDLRERFAVQEARSQVDKRTSRTRLITEPLKRYAITPILRTKSVHRCYLTSAVSC